MIVKAFDTVDSDALLEETFGVNNLLIDGFGLMVEHNLHIHGALRSTITRPTCTGVPQSSVHA